MKTHTNILNTLYALIDNFGYAFQSEGHLDLGVNIFLARAII